MGSLWILIIGIVIVYGSTVKLAIKQRNLDQLENILYSISDPKQPSYGKHWDIHQIRSLIGPEKDVLLQITGWLNSMDIFPVRVLPSGDVIQFDMPFEMAQIIFQDKKFHTNNVLPFELHEILDAVLVDGYPKNPISKEHSHPKFKKISNSIKLLGTSDPNTQKQFYQIPLTQNGNNSKNVQMVWGPGTYGVSLDDLSQFYKTFDINAKTSSVQITENQGVPGGDNWGEGTLDTEYITSFAPGVTTLVVNSNTSMSTEEGLGFGYAFLNELLALGQVPDEKLPKVLSLSLGSLSWSSCDMMCSKLAQTGQFTYQDCVNYLDTQRQVCMYDSLDQTNRMNNELMKLSTRGVSIFAATGDGGSHFSFMPFESSPIGDALNLISCTYNFPTFPAASPYVTGVGGIDIQNINQPIAWDGSGSGFSWLFPMPSYQQSLVTKYLNSTASTPNFPSPGSYNPVNRAYPDVSAAAILIPIVIEGQVYTSGGTSASTPTVAGIVSLINDIRLNKGIPALGFLNTRLYQIFTEHPGEAFLDITQGNSKTSCKEGFPAAPGWDPVTGLGSPIFPGWLKYLSTD